MKDLFLIGVWTGAGWGVCVGLVIGVIVVGLLFAHAQRGTR